MNEPHRQISRTGVAIAFIAILLLYPLSFGPACWVVSRTDLSHNDGWNLKLLNVIYAPVYWTYQRSPRVLQELIQNYADLGTSHGNFILDDFLGFDRICFYENAAPGAPFATIY